MIDIVYYNNLKKIEDCLDKVKSGRTTEEEYHNSLKVIFK